MFNWISAVMVYYNFSAIVVINLKHYSLKAIKKFKWCLRIESFFSELRLLVAVLGVWILYSHGGQACFCENRSMNSDNCYFGGGNYDRLICDYSINSAYDLIEKIKNSHMIDT